MGLFSRRPPEPLVHPAVSRTVHVGAEREAVLDHLDAYSSLFSPKRAELRSLLVGAADGWCAIRLPHTVHPWQLHNLACWMLDCPGVGSAVVAESSAGPGHAAYRLVRDPEVPDSLCGWDETGAGWTVHVPGNDIVRPEPVPVQPAIVPVGYADWEEIEVLLEDPGRAMNPGNESTSPSRRALRERSSSFVI